MASMSCWVCAIIILALVATTNYYAISISRRIEPAAPAIMVYRRLAAGTKEVFKVGLGSKSTYEYESKRHSPAGPDPQHHVMDPS
ncbi:hypothetical protein FRX31_018722 [Thalictrum thalictroides]|uniref:CLAVATA3/ESR (CLE)-related protein n=1 Tax=Thalictrum thalictroides TaxID=46969 RepID=A0A7J6W3C4_THATH|nr:hypothetical protein FRX31_018722 [Thalictrum thalictroides]